MTQTPTSPNRRRLLAACALALAAGTASVPALAEWSFGRSEQVQGNGKIVRQARNIGHFNGLATALPGNVEIRTGNSEGLSIETDENLLPLIETVVDAAGKRENIALSVPVKPLAYTAPPAH